MVKNLPASAGDAGWEEPMETGMATHSSILAWRIPWTEEPGGLQSMASQRVGHEQFSMHEIECEKEYLSMYYVCTTELLCCAAETNTALFIIYSSIKCISDNN